MVNLSFEINVLNVLRISNPASMKNTKSVNVWFMFIQLR